jgi:hypothetical protein
MADVVLCFIYYPHSGYVTVLVASIVSEKAIRIILRWHAFGQNSFSWNGIYYKIEKPGIGT